jgi:DNA-binding response OmpR family regulator
MDIRMPGIDGVEAYRHIRRQCPGTFVIFMTAYSNLADEARREGAAEVLAKPLDIEHLCPLLERTAHTRPIIIVDDDPDFCRSLERNLLSKDFDVSLASTAAEAIGIFEKSPRSLVLLDMRLPDQSGLEVLRQLKELNKNALVIEMSGVSEMQEDMREGLTRSASGYLTKPFGMDELFNQLEIAASRRQPK